jgi:hypothetical protein
MLKENVFLNLKFILPKTIVGYQILGFLKCSPFYFALLLILLSCHFPKIEGNNPLTINYQNHIDDLNQAYNTSEATLMFHLDSIQRMGTMSGSYIIFPNKNDARSVPGIDSLFIEIDSLPKITAKVFLGSDSDFNDTNLQHDQQSIPKTKRFVVNFEIVVTQSDTLNKKTFDINRFKIQSIQDEIGIVVL